MCRSDDLVARGPGDQIGSSVVVLEADRVGPVAGLVDGADPQDVEARVRWREVQRHRPARRGRADRVLPAERVVAVQDRVVAVRAAGYRQLTPGVLEPRRVEVAVAVEGELAGRTGCDGRRVRAGPVDDERTGR